MIVNYHGKKYEIVTDLEEGEEELDLYEKDNEDLEKTMEFSNELLGDTMDLKGVVELVGERNE